MQTYQNRTRAMRAENEALDDIARCNRALGIIRKLTIAFQPYPRAVETLGQLAALIIDLKHAAMQRREEASEQI